MITNRINLERDRAKEGTQIVIQAQMTLKQQKNINIINIQMGKIICSNNYNMFNMYLTCNNKLIIN